MSDARPAAKARGEAPERRRYYEISAEVTFAASHQIRNEDAQLETLHGHNFRLEAFLARGDAALPESGLVLDFLDLEKTLREIVAPYDHRHLNDLAPFDTVIPTTENLAHFFFGELEKRLPAGVELRRVRVWEAPTYSATYGY